MAELIDYIKAISDKDLAEMRLKVAKSRLRNIMLRPIRFFDRKEAFIAINLELKRRANYGISIQESPVDTVIYRRKCPFVKKS